MATTQYIGARYVPLFYEDTDGGNQWESGVTYAPLTIVTYNSTSYTSKKNVPSTIGAPPTAPSYWVATSNVPGEVSSIQTRLDAIETDYAETKYLKTLKGVPCLLMGNSWADGTGGTSGRGFPYYMQLFSDCDADIVQQRGGDFIDTANEYADYPNKTAQEALELWAAAQTSDHLEEIKLVVYGGGLNDAGIGGDVYALEYAAVEAFIQKARELMPNAQICIVPLPGLDKFANMGEYRLFLAIYHAAVANGAISTPYYSSWFYGRLEYKTSDNNYHHLNDAGYQLCANYILSLLQGWDGKVVLNPFTSMTAGDYVTSGPFPIQKSGNVCTFCTNISHSGGAFTDSDVLLTLNDEEVRPMVDQFVPCVIWGGDAEHRYPGLLQITSSGDIKYRATGTVAPNSSSTIYIKGMTYTIDCI